MTGKINIEKCPYLGGPISQVTGKETDKGLPRICVGRCLLDGQGCVGSQSDCSLRKEEAANKA